MRKNIYKIIAVAGIALSISCNDFLDVQPRGIVDEEQQFKDVEGFKSAMIGAYSTMSSEGLYGKDLTYGFLDVIGQMFSTSKETSDYYYVGNYDYLNIRVRPKVDNIWFNMYETIAYINNIIEHQEATSLKGSEMQTMKGEAYGLRAFLHFDLLRMFAEDYKTNPNAKGIPYSYTFDLNNKELFSVKGTLENILKDLDTAEKLLANDQYSAYSASLDEGYPAYAQNRYHFFNRDAVKAMKARVYYVMGDMANAQKYASEVINGGLLRLGNVSEFPSKTEMIFAISVNPNKVPLEIYDTFINNTTNDDALFGREGNRLNELYQSGGASNSDVRLRRYYRILGNAKSSLFTRYIRENPNNIRSFDIPLIRLPEMYYILSEAQYASNQSDAMKTLESVRRSRGLRTPINLSEVDTEDKFIKLMTEERTREMPGEGQVFYALKHYNKAFKSLHKENGIYIEVEPSQKVFVLPVPDAEKEFGNY